MAIYENGIAWPPKADQPVFELYHEYEAWLTGRVSRLQRLYSRDESRAALTGYQQRVSNRSEGGLGAIMRLFWGRKTTSTSAAPRTAIHVPIAADIASMASDSLWAEGATFSTPIANPAEPANRQEAFRQARIDAILNSDEMRASLSEGGELCSALGGIYYRVFWDASRFENVQVQPVHADYVVPRWEGHRLVGATVWNSFIEESNDDTKEHIVWRHLEYHEAGRILHELYLGEPANLGVQVPLQSAPDLMGLDWLKPAIGDTTTDQNTFTIITGTRRMTMTYAPNVGRSLELRGGPQAGIGRSDFEGQVPYMNALDEVVSSWLRDIKVGRARLFMDESMLEHDGPGRGSYWDEDAETRVLLEGLGGSVLDGGKQIDAQQFAIRVDEHERTADYFARQIFRRAGLDSEDYSGQVTAASMTATEFSGRSKRAETTRDKRKRYQLAALTEAASVALEIDSMVYRGRGAEPGLLIRGTFPAEQQIDPEKEARVLQTLDSIKAVSLETKIKRANPDWGIQEVRDERKRIQEDSAESARLAMQAMQGAESDDPFADDPQQTDEQRVRSPFAGARA